MKFLNICNKGIPWFGALMLGVLLSACSGGGQSPILGLNGTPVTQTTMLPPTVTAVAPANNATGVPLNNDIITVAFSQPVAPIAGAGSFTLSCTSPCVSPSGTVTLNSDGTIASLNLTAGTLLAPGTV